MRNKLCLLLVSLAISGCVTIQDATVCSVAGVLDAGGICSHMLNDQTSDLTEDQFLDFLEPQPEHPDPDHPDQIIPARGAAVCMSAADWGEKKTELEQACRLLGSRCSYSTRMVLRHLK